MSRYYYEARQEEYENYGTPYTSYAIFAQEGAAAEPVCHDAAMDAEDAAKLCALLNAHGLELEQARYVIEDYITEKYLVEI